MCSEGEGPARGPRHGQSSLAVRKDPRRCLGPDRQVSDLSPPQSHSNVATQKLARPHLTRFKLNANPSGTLNVPPTCASFVSALAITAQNSLCTHRNISFEDPLRLIALLPLSRDLVSKIISEGGRVLFLVQGSLPEPYGVLHSDDTIRTELCSKFAR